MYVGVGEVGPPTAAQELSKGLDRQLRRLGAQERRPHYFPDSGAGRVMLR